MKKRNIICLLLAVLTLLACTACGGKTATSDTAGTRTITDSKNRTVTIPDKVERIVCVGVGALRYSCYVGAADRVVGVEDYETKAGMSRLYNYVNFDKFKDLPVTGTNGEPYVEQIIDVAPQVIVMSAYASCDADELSAKTGIPVFVVPGSDTTLDDAAYETIRLLGESIVTKLKRRKSCDAASRPTSNAHGQDCRRSEAVRLCRRRVHARGMTPARRQDTARLRSSTQNLDTTGQTGVQHRHRAGCSPGTR